MKRMRLLLRAAAGAALVYVLVCAGLIVSARTLIYPFQEGYSAAMPVGVPGARPATIIAADGTPVTVWVVPPSGPRPVILYFMGNAGALPMNGPRLAELALGGFGVAALNYRGAGGAPGSPTQDALTADALALYDGLADLLGKPVPAQDRVIFGTSLGAAVAVQLAARRPAAALILEAPFNRMCEVAKVHYPFIPACLLLPYDRWDSAALIGRLAMPVLIQHGEADDLIPLSQGRALFDAAPEPKRLIVYPGGNHNDLRLYGAGIDAIEFIESALGH